MLIDQYYNETNGKINFSRQQASDFAKSIADDFNPIHNIDSRRFCVPGDLLFALVLSKYGVTKHMRFTFSGMVTDQVHLQLPADSPQLSFSGENDKEYLSIEHSGENSADKNLIDALTHSYIKFSGHTFPLILIPLLQGKGVMINPDRPIVMYHASMTARAPSFTV